MQVRHFLHPVIAGIRDQPISVAAKARLHAQLGTDFTDGAGEIDDFGI